MHITRNTNKIINSYKILVGKPEGKRSSGRLRHGRENNIKMEVNEIQCQRVDWIHLTQDGLL
jgi:hypothetical protein